MEIQTVTITRPETFLVWAGFVRPDLEITEHGAEILLGYMEGHDYRLVLQDGELFRRDLAEEHGEMQPYDIEEVIDTVCEWNYELKMEALHGMENPKNFVDFCNYKDVYDAIERDCGCLDEMFARTRYGRENKQLVERIVAKAVGMEAVRETVQKMVKSESVARQETEHDVKQGRAR